MKPLLKRLPFFLAAVAASLWLVDLGWMQMKSFTGLLLGWGTGFALLAWSLGGAETWPKAAPSQPTADRPSLPGPLGYGALALGLGLLGLGFALALKDQLAWTLACLLSAAVCWRPLLPTGDEPGLERRWIGWLALLAMAAGALFRFYRVGDIPTGLLTVDEPRLMELSRVFLKGSRETFWVDGGIGCTPYWVEAAAMKLFGQDITGFRMSAAIPGLALVGLLGLLAMELVGSRLALLTAGFAAVCLWPVSFSRQEYLVASSLVAMVGAPAFFLWGLRRGSRVALLLGGFLLGLCFSLYNPARLVPLLMLLLGLGLWLQRQDLRQPLAWSLLPLLGGMLLGLAPLLAWASRDPGLAYRAYFGNLNMEYMAGREVMEAQGVLAKFDVAFGRILPYLGRLFTIFTTHGGSRAWFFKIDQPVVDQATLFLLLTGLVVCLVRFRNAAYALVLTWWLLGLTPTLLAVPGVHMDERRISLAMPATILLAAIGLHGLFQLALLGVKRRQADRLMLAAALVFFASLAANNWLTYFHDMELDRKRQDFNHFNFDQMTRAIFKQDRLAPVTVVSTRKPNEDSWWGSNPANELVEHWVVLGPIPSTICANNAEYLAGGGLFNALAKAPGLDERDPLVVLTPFHFYLEPLLEKLGGVKVADIPPVRASDGLNYTDVGMAWDKASATRLYRLKGFKPEKLEALKATSLYPYTAEELAPPHGVGTREQLSKLWLLSPEHIKAIESYDQAPGRWRAGKSAGFSVADPWFWVTSNNFPGDIRMPLRLRAQWVLRVPTDGSYALGASASVYTRVRVDGKTAFTYLPRLREQAENGRNGELGAPVELKAGDHRLDVEQVSFSGEGNFNHLIRLLWQKPGGEKETLPLAALVPAPPQR